MLQNLSVNENTFTERKYFQEPHAYRSAFERDRTRVVYCKAFRRLEYKTQVFVNHQGDNYRTRLTHSLEVAQVSRTISKALNLNQDLAETLALAHDIGHPPFGHSGEEALNKLVKPHGFDHNKQSLRIVSYLETYYPEFDGLNLTKAVRYGLQKHKKYVNGLSHTIEAQLVDLSDEISYNCHDIEDGLDAGLLNLSQLEEVALFQRFWQQISDLYPKSNNELKIKCTLNSILDYLVSSLIESIKASVSENNIKTFNDVINFKADQELVRFNPQVKEELTDLKKFLFRNLYRHPQVDQMNKMALRVIPVIYHDLTSHPNKMPKEYFNRIEKDSLSRVICDFISGMTDRYALDWHEKLTLNQN